MIADTSAITIVDVEEPKTPAKQQQQQQHTDEPYSIFTTRTKILIVLTVSISAFFSPFSTNIYFPALSMIEKASSSGIYIQVYWQYSALGPQHYRTHGQLDCNHVHGVSGHCAIFLGKSGRFVWTKACVYHDILHLSAGLHWARLYKKLRNAVISAHAAGHWIKFCNRSGCWLYWRYLNTSRKGWVYGYLFNAQFLGPTTGSSTR